MEMLRDKIKGFERQLIEMIRNGQENAAIADKLHRWTRSLMLTANAADLPDVLVRELRHEFVIPQAAIRVWGGAEAFAGLSFARGVDDDVRSFAASLGAPVLRRQRRLRRGAVARRSGAGAVDRHDPAAPREPRRRLRPAGARLARPDPLHRRHGHGLPGAHRRGRERGADAAAAELMRGRDRPTAGAARRRHRPPSPAPGGRAAPRGAHAVALRRSVRPAAALRRRRGGAAAPGGDASHPPLGGAAPRRRPGAAQHRPHALGLARPLPLARRRGPGRRQPGRRRARAARRAALAQGAVGRRRGGAGGASRRRRLAGAGGARCLHRRAALRLRPAGRRAGRARRRRQCRGGRLDRRRRCQRPRPRQGQQAAQRAGGQARAAGARGVAGAARRGRASRRAGALRQPPRHPADGRARCARA